MYTAGCLSDMMRIISRLFCNSSLFPFPRKRESPCGWGKTGNARLATNSVRAMPAPEIGRFPLSREWGKGGGMGKGGGNGERGGEWGKGGNGDSFVYWFFLGGGWWSENERTDAKIKLLPIPPPLFHSRESGNLPMTGAGRATLALLRLWGKGREGVISPIAGLHASFAFALFRPLTAPPHWRWALVFLLLRRRGGVR